MADGERPKKRGRYSIEPDLEVEVEGKVFNVRSQALMVASPVFAAMLTSEMCESESGRIKLASKRPEDFEEVLRHLDLRNGACAPGIETDHVETLLAWADEYQIEGLKARCEEVVLADREADPAGLRLALRFGLKKFQERCVESVVREIYKYRDDVRQFVQEPSIMKMLMSEMCKQADLKPPEDMESDAFCLDALWLLHGKDMGDLRRSKKAMDAGDFEYYKKRARALRKTISDMLPQVFRAFGSSNPTVEDVEQMMSVEEIKKKCKGSYNAEEVHSMIERMLAKGHLRRDNRVKEKLYFSKSIFHSNADDDDHDGVE
eukprot:gnl/TRDRNA2_/TRDRNA2_175337_c0_seq5.p1 gnl/TRDRNA2_/TRDRNA2_175337_c0~~gnl/TRDRNA2_/TRDRNA2_175337_c0_seq5.p1  ORF type:complete len:342 (-),score=74.76 gnl/TRDRNA2_/TRDRNA2_175337_c0_seq5:166-1119(-)